MWIGFLMFRSQQAIERSQLAINEQELQRLHRRHASRMWWVEAKRTPQITVLQIRNRSTITMREIVVMNDTADLALLPGELPPCSILTISIVLAVGWSREGVEWHTGFVLFRDSYDRWIRDSAQLRAASEADGKVLTLFAQGLSRSGPMFVRISQNETIRDIVLVPPASRRLDVLLDCGD